jgi:hypothetical protein
MGRFAEARREAETAYRLDPLSVVITSDMCATLYYERRYREAIQFVETVEGRDPERAPIWCATSSMLALGAFDEFLEYRKTHGTPPIDDATRERFRREGQLAFYRARLANWKKTGRSLSPVVIASGYAIAGNADEAFAWLEKGFAERLSDVVEFHIEPELDPIRDDPRFADLARRLGIPPPALEASRALAREAPHSSVAMLAATRSGSGTPPRPTAAPAD